MQSAYLFSLLAFFVVMLGIAIAAGRKVHNVDDFIVAGRHMNTPLLSATLIATWFGAGSLSISADTVYEQGLRMTALEPLGVGFCLLFAGWFIAHKAWPLNVLTLVDIVRNRFGLTAEKLQVIYSISYLGWISVQLLALGNIIAMVTGFDANTSIVLVTLLLTVYTLLGGMWSVALTDAVQVLLLIGGLIVLTLSVVAQVHDDSLLNNLLWMWQQHDPEFTQILPSENRAQLLDWVSLFLLGSLGNIASQDLMQRIFSARSASIARRACLWSGSLYIVIASMPVVLAMAAKFLLPTEITSGIVSELAKIYLSPVMSVIFILTLTAAITSSVDSALLAPASVFSQNFLRHLFPPTISSLTLTRAATVAVAAASAWLALSGTKALDLLQSSYTLGITPLVILGFALYQKTTYAAPAVVTSIIGLAIWLAHMIELLFPHSLPASAILEAWFPLPITMLLLNLFSYLLVQTVISFGKYRQPVSVLES